MQISVLDEWSARATLYPPFQKARRKSVISVMRLFFVRNSLICQEEVHNKKV